jgi:argininosuccinate lyase
MPRVDVRGRRLRKQSKDSAAFTSSLGADRRIAGRVIEVNSAHMAALLEAGAVEDEVGAKCLAYLRHASAQVGASDEGEDFHQLLEQRAVDELGIETAGYLNLGKSRNDQVATAVRMELRALVLELSSALVDLQESELRVARKHAGDLLPGYTHLQHAQPVTIPHHFFAHFDSLQRDVERLGQLYSRVNLCPMGSAALAGTPVRLDRERVAALLGFDGIVKNSMDAVSSRDFVVEALSCALMAMLDMSRLAEELVLWSSKEFGFIELSDEFSASSSIMPQKKNAVVAELARAKAGSVLGSLVAVASILKALPYSYNLDLQETTPHLWRAMDDAISSARVLAGALSSAKFDSSAVSRAMSGDYSTATALADHLVSRYGISFRRAHAVVGGLVTESVKTGLPLAEVAATRLGQASGKDGLRMNIDLKTAFQVLDQSNFLSGISTEGGANPSGVRPGVAARQTAVRDARASVSKKASALKKASTEFNRILREKKGR